METVPKGYKNIGIIMSNLDHEIDEKAEERLKTKMVFGEYTAWNFWAAVWFADNVFKCMVKQYQRHIDTFMANDLYEVMKIASDRYGFS